MQAICALPGDDFPAVYDGPKAVFSAYTHSEVVDVLWEAERAAVRTGCAAIGFVAYDAAPAFDAALRVQSGKNKMPLACFGLFDPAQKSPFAINCPAYVRPLPCRPSISKERYAERIALIKDLIAAGETYQVNFTFRLLSRFTGKPAPLFAQWYRRQPTPYSLLLQTDEFAFCSLSPELFFEKNGTRIVCRPMKGTAERGATEELDASRSSWLKNSEKNKAENLMIVDMIRNDLGRIARTGSVEVSNLFALEPYPTVWQMTSTVCAETQACVADIFRALFPCASITGAPKVRTMEIIRDIECSPRGIYTGALGFILPEGLARFSVAIRTAFLDRAKRELVLGIGGGIVWDSEAESEYNEALLKARFLGSV